MASPLAMLRSSGSCPDEGTALNGTAGAYEGLTTHSETADIKEIERIKAERGLSCHGGLHSQA